MQVETMAQRHSLILNKLQQEEFVKVVDLAAILGVSLVTVRKDIKFLENRNLLYKSHGAIYKNSPYGQEDTINAKVNLQRYQKIKIGAAAAKLVQPHDAILMASGTTVLQMANALQVASEKTTIVTSAMNVAMALRNKPNVDVIQLGGIMRPSSTSVVGPYAEEMLKDFSFSKLFLSVEGVEKDYGCSTTNLLEAKLNHMMMQASQKTIILIDSTKFGKKGFGKICDLKAVHQIITDSGIDQKTQEEIIGAGVELTVV